VRCCSVYPHGSCFVVRLETFGTALLIHVLFPSICPALVYVSSRLTSNIWGTPVTTMSYLYYVEEKYF